MITGRTPELTIKFTERPQNIPEEGKKVVLEVRGENDITVKAEVNRKSLKKIVKKMDTWDQWVASLSGKMKSLSASGLIELDEAGINIFEIVPKDKKLTQTTSEKAPQQNQGKQQAKKETKQTGKAPAKNKPKARPKAKPNVKEKIS